MFSIQMIQALLLLIAVTLGAVRGAPEGCDCFQSFLVNGTTTVNQVASDGEAVPMTIINMTPIFAPCGTDWKVMRETLTVIATDCDQIQTRDEPFLTSMDGTQRMTCFVGTPTSAPRILSVPVLSPPISTPPPTLLVPSLVSTTSDVPPTLSVPTFLTSTTLLVPRSEPTTTTSNLPTLSVPSLSIVTAPSLVSPILSKPVFSTSSTSPFSISSTSSILTPILPTPSFPATVPSCIPTTVTVSNECSPVTQTIVSTTTITDTTTITPTFTKTLPPIVFTTTTTECGACEETAVL